MIRLFQRKLIHRPTAGIVEGSHAFTSPGLLPRILLHFLAHLACNFFVQSFSRGDSLFLKFGYKLEAWRSWRAAGWKWVARQNETSKRRHTTTYIGPLGCKKNCHGQPTGEKHEHFIKHYSIENDSIPSGFPVMFLSLPKVRTHADGNNRYKTLVYLLLVLRASCRSHGGVHLVVQLVQELLVPNFALIF